MARYTKEKSFVNHLLDIAVNIPQRININEQRLSSAYFGAGSSNISFLGAKHLGDFNDIVKHLYTHNKEIELTYSINEFQRNFVELLRTLKRRSERCDEKRLEVFISGLLEVEREDYEVFCEIHGVVMSGAAKHFGDFTIYKISEALGSLKKKYAFLNVENSYEQFESSGYWISRVVSSRDSLKAQEQCNPHFEIFEYIIGYMLLDPKAKTKARIFNPITTDSIKHIACSSDKMAWGETFNNNDYLDLDSPLFCNQELGNDKIWEIAARNNKSDIEKRLLSAIQWIGKGIRETDPAKSLVQYVFAIEGMFQQNENTLFTPSIISSISEDLSFLIGADYDSRKETAETFKEVYRNRSAIAHGGSKTITSENANQAHLIACRMVIAFLVKEPFCHMKSIKEDFNPHVRILKFT